ncbi:MAG: ATP-binding protein [Nitrospirae bacterium]|nr:ATP-binding protein [Nitrospirota bacterium]MCL5238132.1 ATP-binding protein [Nitrospirota bacterium]
MEDLSLHILDIAENSIDAGACRIEIIISDSRLEDTFMLRIKDNGKGMDEETVRKIRDPFFTTKTARRFGLGIPLLAQSAEESGGGLSIDSRQGKGTTITAEFRRSHIDRKPMGDIGATMMILIGGHPETDFSLDYSADGCSYRFDSAALKKELDGVPVNLPDILKLIRDDINEALRGR